MLFIAYTFLYTERCTLGFSWPHGHVWISSNLKRFFSSLVTTALKTLRSWADLSSPHPKSAAVPDFCFVSSLILISECPCVGLPFHTGSADNLVPIFINKPWDIQDFAVLFLSIRQHPCLLYILSLSCRGCDSLLGAFPSCPLLHKCLLLFLFQVSSLMFLYWHGDLCMCRPVIVFVQASQGSCILCFPCLGSTFVAGRVDKWQFTELVWVLCFHC